MTESRKHQKAVNALKDLAKNGLGCTIWENSNSRGMGGFGFPAIVTGKGVKQWTADVFCRTKEGMMVILEADGKIGHSSKHAYADDNYRDNCLYDGFGIITVRYPIPWILSKKAPLTAEQLLADIEYRSALGKIKLQTLPVSEA